MAEKLCELVKKSGGGGNAVAFGMLFQAYGGPYPHLYSIDDSFNISLQTSRETSVIQNSYIQASTTYPGWSVVITFKKAGYYLIQNTRTGTATWQYKTANSTMSLTMDNAGDWMVVFYWNDLIQR